RSLPSTVIREQLRGLVEDGDDGRVLELELGRDRIELGAHFAGGAERHEPRLPVKLLREHFRYGGDPRAVTRELAQHRRVRALAQIGRASCRERVWVPGGHASLTKL